MHNNSFCTLHFDLRAIGHGAVSTCSSWHDTLRHIYCSSVAFMISNVILLYF